MKQRESISKVLSSKTISLLLSTVLVTSTLSVDIFAEELTDETTDYVIEEEFAVDESIAIDRSGETVEEELAYESASDTIKADRSETVSETADEASAFYEGNDVSDYVTPDNEDYNVGDIVCFGHMPYGKNYFVPEEVQTQLKGAAKGLYTIDNKQYYSDGKTIYSSYPLRWIVVEKQESSLVLMSQYAFFAKAYSDAIDSKDVSWSTSKIRSYLNSSDYYSISFTPEERNELLVSQVVADGEVTEDTVYIPSYDEVMTYFSDNNSRRVFYYDHYKPDVTIPITGSGTALAYDTNNYTCAYWTRSYNHEKYTFAQPTYVDCNGEPRWGGRVYNTWNLGMRPMIRVSTSSEYLSHAVTEIPEPVLTNPVVVKEGAHVVPFSDEYKSLPYSKYAKFDGQWSNEEFSIDSNTPQKFDLGKHSMITYLYGFRSTTVSSKFSVIAVPQTETINGSIVDDQINISWQREYDRYYSLGSEGYEIQRRVGSDGQYETVFWGKLNSEYNDEGDRLTYTYVDDTAVIGQTYYYRVRGLVRSSDASAKDGLADNIDGYSGDFSNEVSVKLDPVEIAKNGTMITYELNGGTNHPDNVNVVSFGTSFYLKDPFKPGYSFGGWFTDQKLSKKKKISIIIGIPDSNITVYAKWTADQYMVNYDGNGATQGSTKASKLTYDKKGKLAKCGFKKTGYKFKEWNTQPDGTGTSYPAKESAIFNLSTTTDPATLYVIWKPIEYTVQFKSPDKDQSMAAITGFYDDSVILPDCTFTKPGYNFDSWNTRPNGKGTKYDAGQEVFNLSAKDKAKVTLYPIWSYEISFDGNGGDNEMPDQLLYFNVSEKLNSCSFVREGYKFNGWKATIDGKSRSFKDQASVKNLVDKHGQKITLIAQWKPVK